MPVRVQGAGASLEIKNALQFLDGLGVCDVIILGRGGGSLEDLWAFNEELVARAIFAAKTPIISAVGHETDTTISDFVADLRAATPTHAASLVVPELKDLVAHLQSSLSRMQFLHEAKIKNAKIALMHEKRRLKDPRILLFRHWQRLDEMQKKLEITSLKSLRDQSSRLEGLIKALQLQAPFRQLRLKREAVMQVKNKLLAKNPCRDLARAKATVAEKKRELEENALQKLNKGREGFAKLFTKLDALSPLRVLSRGYGLIEDEERCVLSKIAQLSLGQIIRIRLEDGMVKAAVMHRENLGVNDGKDF